MRTPAWFMGSVVGATLLSAPVARAQTPSPGAAPPVATDAPPAPPPPVDTTGQPAGPPPAPPPAAPPPPAPPPAAPPPAAPPPAAPPPAAPPPAAPPPAAPPATPPPPAQPQPAPPPPPSREEGLHRLHVSFAVDRSFGFYAWNGTGKPNDTNIEYTLSGTSTNFLVSDYLTNYDEFLINPSAVPRLSVDAFPVAGLSLGGSIGVWHVGGETEASIIGEKATLTSTTGYLLAPRVGYLVAFSPHIGLWPRAGIMYVHSADEYTPDPGESFQPEDTTSTTVSFTQVSIEALLVLSPVSHFAFTVGPVVDQGIGGSVKEKSQAGLITSDVDFTFSSYGVAAGIMGFL